MSVPPRGDEDFDFDARFAAIISPIADSMDWDADLTHDSRLESGQYDAISRDEAIAAERAEKEAAEHREAEQRDARRAQRRVERAQELAEYNADKAAAEAAYNSDDGHFTPPPPPPLPRLRGVTIGGVLLVFAGIVLIAFPALLVIDTQLTMILGLLLLMAGVGTLVSRLRRSNSEDDNGAVL